jgi:hypothetical protein
MKKKDGIILAVVVLLVLPFLLFSSVKELYQVFNANYPLLSSFLKFSLLATFGEMLGLRIQTGNYLFKGFGVLPRAIVWGLLGVTVKMAFVVFATGVPVFLEQLGWNDATQIMSGLFSFNKLGVAFVISCLLNLIYAPVLMTLHRITDIHIVQHDGRLKALLHPVQMERIFTEMNWGVQWSFVFKKTIPMFWIPAHTITFLLPVEFRVLFAAILGVMLGVLLAIAGVLKK